MATIQYPLGTVRSAGSYTSPVLSYQQQQQNYTLGLQNELLKQQTAALKKQNEMTWQEVKPQLLETEEQKAAKAYLTGQMNTDQMYGGQRFAENQYANDIRGQLAEYLKGTQSSPLMASASQQVQDTLGGTKYDPLTGAYYQGVRQKAEMNLNDALQKYRQNQYLKGNLRSTVTDAGQGRMLAENTANLNTMLGTLQNQERQNQLAAIGQASALAGQYDALAQSRLGQTQTTGEYLRGLEQQQKDFAYEQWKQNLERKNAIANQLFTTAQTYAYPQYQLR
jgi:hypothetical protein